MRKRFIVLWLTTVMSVCAAAADLQSAEELYRQGKFAAALGEYEELLNTYPKDSHLYYNIGNCYFKMGSTGLAVANYYRAFRLDPRDGDIRHNLALALENSGERLVPSGMPEILHKAFFSLQTDELKGLFFLSVWLFCILGALWLIKRKWGRAALAFFVIALALGVWYSWRTHLEQTPLAIVAAPVAELRSGPGTNFPASASVAQGHILVIQDTKDNWYDVIVKSQGLQGWVEADTVEKI